MSSIDKNRYLHEKTLDRVQTMLDQTWIRDHYMTLINMPNSGCKQMYLDDKVQDLKRMYMLFSRCPESLKGVLLRI